MEGLLKITMKENKLQTKMDKLTEQIDKLHKIIQEQEAKLQRFKKQKEVVSIHVFFNAACPPKLNPEFLEVITSKVSPPPPPQKKKKKKKEKKKKNKIGALT